MRGHISLVLLVALLSSLIEDTAIAQYYETQLTETDGFSETAYYGPGFAQQCEEQLYYDDLAGYIWVNYCHYITVLGAFVETSLYEPGYGPYNDYGWGTSVARVDHVVGQTPGTWLAVANHYLDLEVFSGLT